jgi:ABC-type multidrug transport system ATPase subunit
MCDVISIIQGGKIIARGDVAQLRALAVGDTDHELTEIFLKLTGGGGLQEIDEGF